MGSGRNKNAFAYTTIGFRPFLAPQLSSAAQQIIDANKSHEAGREMRIFYIASELQNIFQLRQTTTFDKLNVFKSSTTWNTAGGFKQNSNATSCQSVHLDG